MIVCHKIGTEGEFTNTLEEILAYDGQITFDGAYDSVREHAYELAKREPIMFVQGDTVGTPGVMSWSEIFELEEMGFVLGWHGWSHRKLTELPDHVVIKELENNLKRCRLYAYPHGDFDERTKKLVQDMGYIRAYSTTQGDGSDFAIVREYL